MESCNILKKERESGTLCISMDCTECKVQRIINMAKETGKYQDKPKTQKEILKMYDDKIICFFRVKEFVSIERQEAIKNCKYIIENCGLEYSKDALYIFKVFFNISDEEMK